MTKRTIKQSKKNKMFYFRCAVCNKKQEAKTKQELIENFSNFKFYGYACNGKCYEIADKYAFNHLIDLGWYGMSELRYV